MRVHSSTTTGVCVDVCDSVPPFTVLGKLALYHSLLPTARELAPVLGRESPQPSGEGVGELTPQLHQS